MKTTIRKIGDSHWLVIPQRMLAQVGLAGEVDIAIERGALVLRKARKGAKPVRAGWAEAAKKVAAAGGDQLIIGEFGKEADAQLTW